MRNSHGLIAVAILLSATLAIARPALAVRGIYCTSYSYVARSAGMLCLTTCVICVDLDSGETVAEVCDQGACWFREV